MAVTNPCKAREPRVIDNELIEKCIDYQYPKGEIGRLMKQEGIPMEEIQEIRFEFMNILKIDHLWILKSLTKLQLNNNYIEKIENLNTLIHLKELDLSFNRISKIENLEQLVDLKKLCLYENLIEKLENMDQLTKLTILSIGKNKITNRDNILYLRNFSDLTSLNMAYNPCVEEGTDFRAFIAAFLPQVVYYEYKRIDQTERDQGLSLFERQLRNLHKIEEEENEKKAALAKEKADAELHSLSFVEYLNSSYLFDKMFEGDIEGKALLDMGDDIQEYYDEYQEQFVELCKQAFEIGQKHYQIRTLEIEQFYRSVDEAKKSNQDESIGHMENFLVEKSIIFSKIRTLQQHLDNDIIDIDTYKHKIEELSTTFHGVIHDNWYKLMKLELQLFEQLEEVNANLEHALADMINAFIEEEQAIFSQIRSLETNYRENISDVGTRFLTTANLDDSIVPTSLKSILIDKDALLNAIGTTHDFHMQVIDNREDTLINRSKQWLENFTKNLDKEEIKRNRYKLLEINHFLDIQREELDEIAGENVTTLDQDDETDAPT